MNDRIIYETHSHTPLCKHAIGEPEEYAEVAERRGLRGLTVTCHNPMPDGFSSGVRMAEDQFDEYVDLVARARETYAGRVDVRLGLEADYFPGHEAYLERQLSSADFNYVLGSVHPQIREYQQRYFTASPREFQVSYFESLVEAAETGLFDSLAHPDLVKNCTPGDWKPAKLLDLIRKTLDRIADTGMAMELNTSGMHKIIAEMNPFPAMLAEMCQRGIPVTVGADAHEPRRVGEAFLHAYDLLEEAGYTSVSFFIERERQDVLIEQARASLLSHTASPAKAS